jgi:single-strand DNA-binding protein
MNNINLIGRLTKDVELKNTDTTTIANFLVAVPRKKNKEGVIETDFFRMIAFGKTAELISTYFKKGNQIGINGALQNRSYEKDGEQKYITEIIVRGFTFIDKKQQEEQPKEKPKQTNNSANTFEPEKPLQQTKEYGDPFSKDTEFTVDDEQLPF